MKYDEAVAQHRWGVPEHYNIAQDVCDKHPRDKLAMVWADWRGNERRVDWGELQDLSNRAANVLAAHGVERGDRVAVVLPPTPETAAVFFGHLEARGDPALDVGALRRRGDPHRLEGLGGQGAGHRRRKRRAASTPGPVEDRCW